MPRKRTSPNVRELIPGKPQLTHWEKVTDDKGRRVLGLWKRKGIYCAQLSASGKSQQYKYRLEHAETVPQAITAMQVLKGKQRDMTASVTEPARTAAGKVDVRGSTFAIFYQDAPSAKDRLLCVYSWRLPLERTCSQS